MSPAKRYARKQAKASWLPHALGVVSGAGLGQELALSPVTDVSQTVLAQRLRRLALEVLVPLWRQVASKSEVTRSRWRWT